MSAPKGELVTAVWLRRAGDNALVLVEVGGKWHLAITERAEDNFSHIANIPNALTPDPLTTPKEAP